jgi:potassium efflux system protein
MYQMIKGCFVVVGLLCFLSVASFAQIKNGVFEYERFSELATRAESVVSNHKASSDSLGKLRSDLIQFRAAALGAQKSRASRVATIQRQIIALGAAPADGMQEAESIALRRAELTQQLQDVRAPMVIESEAYLRASGLISEIDEIIRDRKKGALLIRNKSPLGPAIWPKAIADLKFRIIQIISNARINSSKKAIVQLRKQNMPALLVLIVFGLFLMVPAPYWLGHRLKATREKSFGTLGNVKQLLISLGIFFLPMMGLTCLLAAVELADIFSVRGELLIRSIPMMGVSIFGAIWFVNNLPSRNIFNDDQTDEIPSFRLHGQVIIMALGVVMAISSLLIGISSGANWTDDVRSVLGFPLIILLGAGLFQCGRILNKFLNLQDYEEHTKSIPERTATIFMWACYISGIAGPLLSAIGYSKAGGDLVYSMVQTLALTGALFVIYSLLVNFISNLSLLHDQQNDERSTGGIYKIAISFVLLCATIPVLALIWGASVTDISDVWYNLNSGVSLGETRISIYDILIFFLIFFIGYTLTKLMQSVLRTVVFPSTRIESGAQNALATGFGYVGFFIAGLIAVTATGLDLSNLAIVAGALSVGIGFGLQTIVSNFVSGIILLIERPVKIGDWVEIGTYMGTISKISVRSTTIDTFDGASVIVPNADLIAGTVTNWTHGNVRGRVKVPVGVAYGTDPELVKSVLLSIADDHPMILKNPKPVVVFMGFGADSMDFQLRGILRDINYVLSSASDMNFEIVKRFAENDIVIPFAQREVTIKNATDFLPTVKKPARKTIPKAKV